MARELKASRWPCAGRKVLHLSALHPSCTTELSDGNLIPHKVVPQFGIAFSWFISTISLGLIRGWNIYSHWDYKPTYNWGGTTLQILLELFQMWQLCQDLDQGVSALINLLNSFDQHHLDALQVRAILATMSKTHCLLSTSFKQRNQLI